jgi:hypothetical protein
MSLGMEVSLMACRNHSLPPDWGDPEVRGGLHAAASVRCQPAFKAFR